MSDITKKYFSTSDMTKATLVPSPNIEYWMENGLMDVISPVDMKNGRRLYNAWQRDVIIKMAKLMKTKFYTVKGALAYINSGVEIPIPVKRLSPKKRTHYSGFGGVTGEIFLIEKPKTFNPFSSGSTTEIKMITKSIK